MGTGQAFDGSAVVGEFISLGDLGRDVQDLRFTLSNRDNILQEGCTQNMLFSVNQLIAEVSRFMTLKVGDLLFTGTPAGVAPVKSGDRLVGTLEGRDLFAVDIK